MKAIILLFGTALLALGCEQEQDVGGNVGGAGGGSGTGGVELVASCVEAACGADCLSCPPNEPQCEAPSYPGHCTDGVCVPYEPQCDAPVCGDQMLNTDTEECDDGNQIDGDGCSANCTVESPCLDMQCGSGCLMCPPNQPNCTDPSYQGYCDLDGACVAVNPTCQ